MKNFYNFLRTRYLAFILLTIISSIIYSCKKDMFGLKHQAGQFVAANDLSEIQKQFAAANLQAKLIRQYDTIKIEWKPDWTQVTQNIKNDTLKYDYIPLNGEISSPHLKRNNLSTRNTEKYLIVVSNKSGIEFKLANYVAEANSIVSSRKQQSIGISKIYYVNHSIPFKSFTGNMSLKDLNTNKSYAYRYDKGIYEPLSEILQASGSANSNKSLNSLKVNQTCLYTFECSWYNNYPEYCGTNDPYYTESSVYKDDGDTIYDSDCGGYPSQTYTSNTGDGAPCQPAWSYAGVNIVSITDCYNGDDPPPPPPPPGDPNDPGNSSGGGNGDSTERIISKDTIITVDDPTIDGSDYADESVSKPIKLNSLGLFSTAHYRYPVHVEYGEHTGIVIACSMGVILASPSSEQIIVSNNTYSTRNINVDTYSRVWTSTPHLVNLNWGGNAYVRITNSSGGITRTYNVSLIYNLPLN